MPYIDRYEIDDEQPGWKNLAAILDGVIGLDMPFHELLRGRTQDLIEEDDAQLVLGRTVGVEGAQYGIEVIRLQEAPPHRKLVAILLINQSLNTQEKPIKIKKDGQRRSRRTRPRKD